MSLSVVEKPVDIGENQANAKTHQGVNSTSWVDRMLQSMASKNVIKEFQYTATLHPCIIDGERVLVYVKELRERGIVAYAKLKQFAKENNYEPKEDKPSAKKNM